MKIRLVATLMLALWTAWRGGFGQFRGLPRSGWWLLVLLQFGGLFATGSRAVRASAGSAGTQLGLTRLTSTM